MKISILKKSNLYFVSSFAALILCGACLMKSHLFSPEKGLAWIDALFMSSSAVCVTGLTVVNTSEFSSLGQLLILLLIQCGGLGLMTITTVMVLFVSGEMRMENTLLVSKVSSIFSLRELEKVIYVTVVYTFAVEITGALLMMPAFHISCGYGILKSFYYAFFHSVSAFCNAGFSIYDNSFMQANWYIKVVISLLIILGGIGYYVVYDIYQHWRLGGTVKAHTKTVIAVTAILILTGMFLMKAIEWNGMSWLDAYFQSVTARTAGYNSVDICGLHSASILVLIVLMIIGASPGSTGGGVKTTTAALAFIAVRNIFKGNNRVYLFKRQVQESDILKAYAIITLYLFVAFLSTMLILVIENGQLQMVLFEVVSALSTVGLSDGYTAKAGFWGKLILSACMFVGRVGPFSLIIFLISMEKQSKISYPQENLILG
ncbi:MAG: hypothetical protein A2017_01750 [Lentisphaerae bacterium GWF2_44_16]|nr:MAG: hypothetical protein A2017_01750 [Lentisphaerae bacterium GWF2_44_16]